MGAGLRALILFLLSGSHGHKSLSRRGWDLRAPARTRPPKEE
jgi:hypothetical protein